MSALSIITRIQALAFAAYGIAFYLAPDPINDAVFGWAETESIFGRVIGASFLGIAWLEWRLSPWMADNPSWAYPFALIPLLFAIAFVWDRAADTFTGPDSWWWPNFIVSVVFTLLVGGTTVSAVRRQDSQKPELDTA